jgi:hypothetical protein
LKESHSQPDRKVIRYKEDSDSHSGTESGSSSSDLKGSSSSNSDSEEEKPRVTKSSVVPSKQKSGANAKKGTKKGTSSNVDLLLDFSPDIATTSEKNLAPTLMSSLSGEIMTLSPYHMPTTTSNSSSAQGSIQVRK